MVMTSPRPEAPDLSARNRRIRELRNSDREYWSLGRLGREFDLTKQAIAKILDAEPTAADVDAALLGHELRLRHELVDLLECRRRPQEAAARAETTRRLGVVRRTLSRIEEEREARSIDRLLGLA